MSEQNERTKPLEILIMVFAVIMIAAASTAFLLDFPLHTYLFGPEVASKQERVGKLTYILGSTRTKSANQNAFQGAKKNSDIYNLDTVVTGPESRTTVTLDDGSTINLGPKTMIRIVFENRLAMSGISRATTVDIVAGEVTGQSKTTEIILKSKDKTIKIEKGERSKKVEVKVAKVVIPEPKPTPVVVATPTPTPTPTPTIVKEKKKPTTRVVLDYPAPGARLKVKDGTRIPEREVSFRWRIRPRNAPIQFRLSRISGGRQYKIYEKTARYADGEGNLKLSLKKPGKYVWEVKSAPGQQPMKNPRFSEFSVLPNYRAIQVREPLVAGHKTATSRLISDRTIRKFDITLRWREYPSATSYDVQFFRNSRDNQPILVKKVNSNKYVLNKDKVFTGLVYYRVLAQLPSGFIVGADKVPFRFDFLPPLLVYPQNDDRLTEEDLKADENRIIFTWQKTNFTEDYLFELAQDEEFEDEIVTKKQKDNFFIWKEPESGVYWWRVRSFARRGIKSPPSAPNRLVIQ